MRPILLVCLMLSVQNFTFTARISAATNSVNKTNKITNEPSGVISFERPFFDFGMVNRGQKLSTKFNFTNHGKGPLSIQGIQAACDCASIETAKGKIYAPGESGFIEITFDTKDYSGKVSKAITVITNERSMPDRTLTITALVNSEIDANPPLVDFGEVILNQTPQLNIKLKNNMKSELRVEKIRFNEDYLDVGYTREGKDFSIYVKLKPTAPIGFLKDTIWIKNNSSALPEMPIPVRASIRGQIAASPAYVEFGSIPTSEKSNRQISLTSLENFEITNSIVELNVNGSKLENSQNLLKVNVSAADKGSKKIVLELLNPGGKSGSVHGKVTMQTSNPQQKNLTVDFYAYYK